TIYTHGFGFVGAPANKTVCQGAPYFVSGVLDTSSSQSATGEACFADKDQFPSNRQGIYYGEGMGGYAVGGQPQGASPIEYGGPVGSAGAAKDTYVTYAGKGGVPVGGFLTRLLYAYKFKEPNFVISGIFNQNSKVLYIRDPRDRVQKIAPFLTID